jgi:hypothetical protein
MNMDNDVLLLSYLDKIRLTLTDDLRRALASLYSGARLYKEPRTATRPQSRFLVLVFYESVSPQSQSIPLGPFQIFSKIRGEIRKSRCTTGVNDTGGEFATGVNNTGGKLPLVSTTPGVNLPPVSTTPAANFATSSPSAVETATGVNDTGSN